MPLPKITGDKVVTIPPVNEKTFADGFITKLYLASPDAEGKQFFQVCTRPYNYETKELYTGTDNDSSHLIANIWEEAQRSATFAQLMGSICQVTSWLIRERQLLSIPKPANEETNEPAVELTAEEAAELATIQTYLGVTG